jgi:hypothetical protein
MGELSYVTLLTDVLFLYCDKSNHVGPVPGYDLGLRASKYVTNPSVFKLYPTIALMIDYICV